MNIVVSNIPYVVFFYGEQPEIDTLKAGIDLGESFMLNYITDLKLLITSLSQAYMLYWILKSRYQGQRNNT